MASTMRTAVVHAFDQPLSIEEVPVPQPGPGEILVRIQASGVRHTELHGSVARRHRSAVPPTC